MTSSRTIRFRVIRRWGTFLALISCCAILPIGCGDSENRESTMPPAEFSKKLETEHPELFLKKDGKTKKTEVMGGREKRAVIRREWERSRQDTQ